MSKITSAIYTIILVAISIFIIVGIAFSNAPKSSITDNSASYQIESYTSNIEVFADNTMLVSETLNVHFSTPSHGIFRGLPLKSTAHFKDNNTWVSKNYRLSYEFISANKTYETYSEGDVFYIKLGSANAWASSNESYTISYRVILPNDRTNSFDHFYYNLLGNYTDTTVESYSVTVNFWKEMTDEKSTLEVYDGAYGSTTSNSNVTWQDNDTTLVVSGVNLAVGEGVTARVVFENGTFESAPVWFVSPLLLVLIILIAAVIILLYRRYSNKKLLVPVVQFTAQKGYTSADVGYIVDRKVDDKDVASLIILWAKNGYLRIISRDKETFVQRIKNSDSSMKMYEKIMFDNIFTDQSNPELSIKEVGRNLATSMSSIKENIRNSNEDAFNKKANSARTAICVCAGLVTAVVLGLVSFLTAETILMFAAGLCGVFVGFALVLLTRSCDKALTQRAGGKLVRFGLIILLIAVPLALAIFTFELFTDYCFASFVLIALLALVVVIICKFNVRSDKGMTDLGDIIGLKNFIDVTERDRLEMLCAQHPTVFYDVLPYAYVLGVYDKWCKKFDGIVMEQPAWYVSDVDVFDAYVFASVLSHCSSDFLTGIDSARLQNVAQHIDLGDGNFGGGSFGGGSFGGGGLGGGGVGRW